ncbi:RloB family protein [Mucilaginibacter sp. OK283]|uniref:RloB family protein n=1 Tax=Mucilaginibacter sp. OK283 TaxID=1881049 RepID=UPI0008D6BA79|nr:RloB family protein [Mucilaginibacter sp. OK283]SEO59163.1 RloB-like protein [Mucilaginibacter sp. OK283]
MTRHPKRRNLRFSVALVGDGFTESIYFTDFRDAERPDNLRIIPDFPGKIGSFSGVLDRAMELAQNYNKVYALIDMDAVIAQQQQQPYLQHKAIALRSGVIVLENNPCFEIWLLLHFKPTGRLFLNCEQVVTELRRFIPNYNKGLKFLEAARLFTNLRDRLPDAMNNAAMLERDRDDHDPSYPRAEVYKFFEWYNVGRLV